MIISNHLEHEIYFMYTSIKLVAFFQFETLEPFGSF